MREPLTRDIKGYALQELGFSLVGVSPATPMEGGRRLRSWLAAGAHGEMHFMEETASLRLAPGNLLPRATSVLCVAMSYHDDHEPPEMGLGTDRAVVARYARRSDYHRVLRRRLVRLGHRLRDLVPGASFRPAVDTAPLLERELAWRAGLGWTGKNTCLINRDLGSEILLGELLTDIDLAPDAPARSHCGTCTACLDACPTGALAEPGFLDARRCISYLTLEHRSQIPASLRSSLGAHLAGCDICQAVCPWNRRAPASCSPALSGRPQLQELSLAHLTAMEDTDWLALVAGTPLRRLDPTRFRRNLTAVAENLPRSTTASHPA